MANLSDLVGANALTNPMTTAGDIIYGGASGTPTRLAKGTDGQVLTLASGNPSWAAAPGGGAIDWASPVSVTTTANLTIGKHHVCSGTTADYTVTLPAVSGNAGKLISIEIAGGATKLITVDGNASETIDGATTRVMWARETAVLLCDGSGWIKVGGKSIPLLGRIDFVSKSQTFDNSVTTLIACDTDNGSSAAFCYNTTNNRIIVPRAGLYDVRLYLHWAAATEATQFTARLYKNGAQIMLDSRYPVAATYAATCSNTRIFSLAANDYLQLYGTYYAGTGLGPVNSASYPSFVAYKEVPQW